MATIYVRKGPYERDGKFGKQYLILGADGIYYEQNKPFAEGIEEGAKCEVEGKLSSNPKYFKLKSVKLLNPLVGSQAGQAPKQLLEKVASKPITPIPAAQLPNLSPKLQAEWIRLAMEGMDYALGKDWDVMAYAPILAELIHHYYGEYVGEKQKARWGK